NLGLDLLDMEKKMNSGHLGEYSGNSEMLGDLQLDFENQGPGGWGWEKELTLGRC
nr:hypothetical protein [Tanacetum cinerariifolium]